MPIQGKRPAQKELRRSIEEQKNKDASSSEDDPIIIEADSPEPASNKKGVRGRRGKNLVVNPIAALQGGEAMSSDPLSETSRTDSNNTPPARKARQKRSVYSVIKILIVLHYKIIFVSEKTLMGLDITPELEAAVKAEETNVRQSRRIAQLKIKEEAERRTMEALAFLEAEEVTKKKSKKDEEKVGYNLSFFLIANRYTWSCF